MTLTPSALRSLQRRRSRRLDRVRDCEQPGQFAVDRHVDHGGAFTPHALALRFQRLCRDTQRRQEVCIAQKDGFAVDLACGALAGRRIEVLDLAQDQLAVIGGADDGVGEGMLAGPFDGGGETQKFVLIVTRRGDDRYHLRLAFGEGARLVHHQRVDLFHAFKRFGVLDEHAGLGAAADADHDGHRGGEPECAGAGDDQHADRGDQPEGHPRLGSEVRPHPEGDERHDDDGRNEPAGNLVREPLDRRARSLRFGDHLDDLGEHSVAADLVGAHDESARLVEGAGDHLAPDFLGDGHGLAGHQRFVQRRTAFENDAVDRHLFAGSYPQPVADGEALDLDFMVGAVVADTAGGFRRQFEKGLDRSGGGFPRPELKHLAEKNEYGNHGSGLEVHGDRAPVAAEGRREDVRRDGAYQAVDVGDAGAHRDQREHVQIARHQRLPAAHEEGPTGPQHDRGGEHKLDPVRQRLVDPAVRAHQVAAHLQHDRRDRKRQADPEASRHVGKFGIGRRIQARDLGLQRHAADRTVAGADLADLRMHWASVDRSGRRFGGPFLVRLAEVLLRSGLEFGPASGRAEMIGVPAVLQPMLAGRGIDVHSADRIANARCGAMLRMNMAAMIMSAAAAPAGRLGSRSCRSDPDRQPSMNSRSHRRKPHHQLCSYCSPSTTCTPYPQGVYRAYAKDIKDSCQKRLSRIEGQVRGLSKMVEEDRYCIDIVTQISAVRAALRRVEEEILKDHVSHCVEHAISSGDKVDQRKKISELMDVIGRADR